VIVIWSRSFAEVAELLKNPLKDWQLLEHYVQRSIEAPKFPSYGCQVETAMLRHLQSRFREVHQASWLDEPGICGRSKHYT
jgi:hypothetical protein